MSFAVGETNIPVRIRVESSSRWVIQNWTEQIILDSVAIKGNVFHADLPLFNTSFDGTILTDSTFAGNWTDHSRDSIYQVPFSARLKQPSDMNAGNSPVDTLIYEATFSPGSVEDESHAIANFYRNGSHVVGTFMTESGDYRFLEGTHTGKSIELSTFDGTHLFYFCANVVGNTLQDGHFLSGKHWSENWIAQINSEAELRDPDSLTFVKEEKSPFAFHVKKSNGDSVLFDSSAFAGKVTIVQIFGSWCPNCTDESIFIRELYQKYHESGLEVIPVAFERTSDLNASVEPVLKQFRELDLRYEPYFGGKKGTASDIFPMLSKILSYPTMVIVDKSGDVRKIHTGFYGPGTGEHYTMHCSELTSFIEELLADQVIAKAQ